MYSITRLPWRSVVHPKKSCPVELLYYLRGRFALQQEIIVLVFLHILYVLRQHMLFVKCITPQTASTALGLHVNDYVLSVIEKRICDSSGMACPVPVDYSAVHHGAVHPLNTCSEHHPNCTVPTWSPHIYYLLAQYYCADSQMKIYNRLAPFRPSHRCSIITNDPKSRAAPASS